MVCIFHCQLCLFDLHNFNAVLSKFLIRLFSSVFCGTKGRVISFRSESSVKFVDISQSNCSGKSVFWEISFTKSISAPYNFLLRYWYTNVRFFLSQIYRGIYLLLQNVYPLSYWIDMPNGLYGLRRGRGRSRPSLFL